MDVGFLLKAAILIRGVTALRSKVCNSAAALRVDG